MMNSIYISVFHDTSFTLIDKLALLTDEQDQQENKKTPQLTI